MTQEELNKEFVKKLLEIKGETRGLILKFDGDFILKERGKEGLRLVEDELERLGCPIKYEELQGLSFYPIGMRAISLLAIEKTFNFGDEKVREIGAFHPKVPLSMRLFVKYLYSIPEILKKIQIMWGKYYTVGKIVLVQYDRKEKYAILELRDFDIHPIICRVIEGHITSLSRMALNIPEVICQETKCTFEGQDCHQFKVTWKQEIKV